MIPSRGATTGGPSLGGDGSAADGSAARQTSRSAAQHATPPKSTSGGKRAQITPVERAAASPASPESKRRMLFSWVDALRQGAANAMIMTMYALLAQAQCLDRSGTARSTQVSTRRRKSGAGVALCDMLRDVETLRIDLSPFQRFVDVERSGLRHKLLALTRVLRDDEVIDVLSRCAELRAACAAPPLDGAGEASRLWEPEYVSFGAGAAYATMRSQALLFKVPYSSSKVAHCQSKALVELWQRLLRPGTPEQAVLLRVYCKTYERVHQLGPAAGMSTVDAQRARAATAEAQAARKAAATGGVPRLSRIAQAVEFGPGRQLGPAFDEAGASCSVDATAARDADSLYDGQITDGDIALAYVEAEMRLAAGGELSTFPSAAGLEGVLNKQQMRALDQARRVEVVGGALFTLATEVGTRTHAFLEQCVGGARARVQNNVHMTVDRRACRAAVCALLFALCRATRSGMLGMLPLAFGVAFFSDRLRGSLKPLSRWIGLTVGAPTVWTHLKLLAQVVMLTSYFYVSGWHGIVIALDNFNQFHHFGASRLANHNNLAFGGPSISCCMTVIMEEMAAWFVLGAYGFTATPLGNVRAADAIIDSSGKARHSLFELLAELHIGPGDVGGCAAPPRQAGASGAPPPRPSRTRLMLRVLLERCRFGETRWFGALPAGRRPVKAGGELDQTAANGGRLPNNVIRQRVITWPLRPFDMARRLDVIRATAEILSMLHIGSAGEFKTALVVGDFIIWQHMLSGLMMTVAQAAVLSEQSAAAHGVLPGLEPRFGARTDPLAAVAPAAAAPAAAHAEAPDELVPPSQWAPLVQLRIGDVRTVVELERLLREYGVGTNLTVKVRKNVLRQLATNWGLNEPLAAELAAARRPGRPCRKHQVPRAADSADEVVPVTIPMMSLYQLHTLLIRTLREQFPDANAAADQARREDPTLDPVVETRGRQRVPPRSADLGASGRDGVRSSSGAARARDIARVLEMQQVRGGDGETYAPAPSLVALPDELLAYLDDVHRVEYLAELGRVRACSSESQRLAFIERWRDAARATLEREIGWQRELMLSLDSAIATCERE